MKLLPTIAIGLTEIEDGEMIKAPVYCKKKMKDSNANKRCDEFHKRVSMTNGLYTCPYGFAVYTSINSHRTFLYIGLVIKGETDFQKIRMKVDLSKTLVLSLSELENIIEIEHKSYLYEAEAKLQNRFLKTSLHNMKKLSQIAEYSLSNVLDRTDAIEQVRKGVRTAYHSTMLVNANYEVFDYSVNIESIESGKPIRSELWGKFYAMQQTLEGLANKKNVRFENPSYEIPKTYVSVYNSFRLLPFLIYENAVKYSPEHSKITTEYREYGNEIVIKISNRGYIYTENQLKAMFNKFYRAIDDSSSESGSGVGLYLAKEICDLHKMTIILSSREDISNSDKRINGIFEVEIRLTK